MASYEGDVILAPGFSKSESANPIEILYSMSGLFQKGGTLTPGQGALPGGTAIAYNAATKRYNKAADAATTVGFLRIGVDTGSATSHPKQGVFVLGGVIKANLANINGTAVNDAAGAALATALGGFYDAGRKTLKF